MTKCSSTNYQTGGIIIRPDLGRLECGPLSEHLGPINIKILMALVENEGNILTRTQLFEIVWPNQVVSDDSLTKSVSEVRNALAGLKVNVKFIRTVPKKGYQWLPDVEANYCDTPVLPVKKSSVKILWMAGSLVIVVLLTAWLALAGRPVPNSIALLPLRTSSQQGTDVALGLERELRLQLVSSKQFALLSAETVVNAPSNAFSYLHQEYSAAYIIEGRVIEIGEQLHVTLNLVHAKTAIVEHTFTAAVGSTEGGNKELVVKYIKLLGPF